VLFLEIVSLQNLIDLFHAVGYRNLVGEIRREHERLGTDPFNGVGQRLFIALAADEDPVVFEIVERMALEFEATLFQFAFKTIDHERNPRRAAFHEAQT
jgi:hypothetical protein